MIRAVHFAERMGFRLSPSRGRHPRQRAALAEASPARLYLELIKVLKRAGAPHAAPAPRDRRARALAARARPRARAARAVAGAAGGPTRRPSHGEPEDLPVAHATWNLLGAADHWGMAAHGADDALALAPLLGPWILPGWHDPAPVLH